MIELQTGVGLLKNAALEILNGQTEGCIIVQCLEGKWRIAWDEVTSATLLIGLLERAKFELLASSVPWLKQDSPPQAG